MQGTRHRPDAVFMDKVALEAIRGKKAVSVGSRI